MPPSELSRLLIQDLAERRRVGLFRERRALSPVDAVHVEWVGRRLVNFASNDYLGLSRHPRVVAAAQGALCRYGAGSGAAGLVSGYTAAHESAERALAAWKGVEAAVLLPSGYQANLAAVQTLAAAAERAAGGGRFLVDKLAHASLIDAVRATGMPFRVVPHNGLAKLERLLADAGAGQLQVVVTESIFSMDGDAADLRGLAELKQRRPFVLLLDEAHGSGVYGHAGAGYAAEVGLQSAADVSVVTLSKALGGVGGAVCASADFCSGLVNAGRAYLFSTSLPASSAAAAEAAVGVLRDEPGRQRRVRDLARRVRAALAASGVAVPAGDAPIVPIRLGDESAALAASARLLDRGFLAVAIRPPTVPRGSSRLRITLSSEHSDEEVADLLRALGEAGAG